MSKNKQKKDNSWIDLVMAIFVIVLVAIFIYYAIEEMEKDGKLIQSAFHLTVITYASK